MNPFSIEFDAIAPVDPRPHVIDVEGTLHLRGWRCTGCGRVRSADAPWCPACRADLESAAFGPAGTVWSSTVVHLDISGLEAPYGLAYVDVDEGPRILAHVDAAAGPIPVGTRVRISDSTPRGDLSVVLDDTDQLS